MIGATLNPLVAAYADAVRQHQAARAISGAISNEQCHGAGQFDKAAATRICEVSRAAAPWMYNAPRQESDARAALLAALETKRFYMDAGWRSSLADEYAEAIRRNQTACAVVNAIGMATKDDTDRLRRLARASARRWWNETTRRETSARQDLLTMLGEVQS